MAAGVAMVASAGGQTTPSSPSAAGGLATAAVVRTTLTNTVQVGGSIGYRGSYTVAAASGTSPQQILQVQQVVIQDRQALSADEQAASDASRADDQTIAAARMSVNTASAALRSDEAKKIRDCSGKGASTPACSQDAQKVTQDRTQLTQARQQLAAADLAATRDSRQNQAKVLSDQTKLQGDQTALESLQATAVNPGTTYTWLPKAGEIITQDRRVYSLNNEPVPLLYGPVTAYRAFYVGMSAGADVRELTHDLIALGFGAGLTESNHYSAVTASAVERWQRALGLPATGEIRLGEVVFEPGPIRVTSVTPSVGSAVAGGAGGGGATTTGGGGGGTVLTATSATQIVNVDLDVTQEYLVRPGDAVSIVLPNGNSTVGGRIDTVGHVATCPGGGGSGLGNGAGNVGGSADQSPCESSGSGSSSMPTVRVTIKLDRTPPGATLDQAPVNVNITTQRADHVLAVPVNALLALKGGGYGVDVVTARGSRLVGVTTGLYSSTLVQVSGSGIAAGMRVQVPAS